jgi:hypothetical protein
MNETLIVTPNGTEVPAELLQEVQTMWRIFLMLRDEEGLLPVIRRNLRTKLHRMEEEMKTEYTLDEIMYTWVDRETAEREHAELMAGQTQGTDGLPDDGTNEEKMMNEELDEKAGERATQLEVEVELDADEQETYVEVVEVEFENGVGAGERTRGVRTYGLSQELAVAESPDNGCGGSVEVAEVGFGSEDWMEDSVVIDIGADVTECGTEMDAGAVADSTVCGFDCGGSVEAAEVGFGFGFNSEYEKMILFDDDAEVDADAIGTLISIEMDAAGLDSLVTGSGSVEVAEVGFGFKFGFKEKMILFADVSETARGDAELKKGSDDMVSGFGPDVISEFVCAIDISGRFGFDILYDPGGSDSGLSSWGLLVSSVFASVEAHNVDVVVLLRALWFYCEIMSFVALEALEAWTFEYSRYRN